MGGKRDRFAPTPWSEESPEWRALEERLPPEHPARRIRNAVQLLDLTPLFESYLGAGKQALRPDLLLQLVLYELHSNRPSPAQWARDVRESEPVRWLLFGLEPSRARLYDFRDRLAPFLRAWNAGVLQIALREKMTEATRGALDGSHVAAHASRRRLLNEERLQKRQVAIDERWRQLQRGEAPSDAPGWLARTETGLRLQKQRYQRAAEVLQERHRLNAQRPAGERKPSEKVLVSPTDPEAVLARDKLNVFRPLYSPQLLRDLDSPLVLSYDTLPQNNDNGVVEPMVAQMTGNLGRQLQELFIDSGFVSLRHLKFCDEQKITVYGPCQENDYSAKQGKKKQSNQHTTLPKSAFRWLAEEQVFQCPEGHRLQRSTTMTQRRADHQVRLTLYVCPPEHCQACPRQSACTPTPRKGRSVSRLENEELLDALRERMATDAAKRLYKLRSQTVELNYADFKEHRGLRRFHGRGLERVKAEVGVLVLAHNLWYVEAYLRQPRPHASANRQTAKTACAA